MEKKSLIVNTGSDSHKYAVYEDGREIARVHLEKSDGGFLAGISVHDYKKQMVLTTEQYSRPFEYLLSLLKSENIITDLAEIGFIGCRIVAPGEFFWTHRDIDDEYLSRLREVRGQAPLHVTPILNEVEEIKKTLPIIRIIGVSDSEFHKDMPEVARLYSLPKEDKETFDIYRYGYHGISVSSILHKVEGLPGGVPERVVICHLGGGCSVTAVKKGKSVDTSMGFTPLEGLVMGSRIGNIDPGAAAYLGQTKGMSYGELENYFNTKCGLLGLSGKTKDVRDLIELEKNGDEGAKLALDSFAYGVRKYIGSYMAVLDGLDLLVFTATIGERSNIMRERICNVLDGLGIFLDETKNSGTVSIDGFINQENSSIKIAVVTTDEMGEIMRVVAGYIDSSISL
ncbi:MAG: acetate/propionate family kinase [Candidatus Vogelbacteria bacterium]|nr:acetate/propionate family kinase [Candidatus Vogelbacteria bacterium]